MTAEQRHEGLVLRAIDYKDRQRILTLLTPERGVLSLIVKGISPKKSHLLAITAPLMHAEYHIRPQRSELYSYVDATPLTTHANLRTSLPHLTAAGTILRALYSTQLPGKPSHSLFRLTLAYLHHLPSAPDPTPLTSSYLLKLLKHESYPLPPGSTELTEIRDFGLLKKLTVPEGHNEKTYDYLMKLTRD
ncbi:MAG: DNA repair protein RecO [Chlamydiae bacterium]|nr:DNA repair protein RecO [Chlamydiota bacterium]